MSSHASYLTDDQLVEMDRIRQEFESKLQARMEPNPTPDQYVRGIRDDFTREFDPIEQMYFIREMAVVQVNTNPEWDIVINAQQKRIDDWLDRLDGHYRVYYDSVINFLTSI